MTAMPATISGLVHDSSGGAVVRAAVIVRTASGPERQTVTGATGRFAIALPTARGVSLGGIGPSGQSRTLVLLDGIPFNGPFGGWVYCARVPMASVDRVEITEDAASSLYGNIAMGGVINIITAHPAKRTIELKPQYGNDNSPKLDFFGSDQWKGVAAAIEGSFLHTDGFPIVEPLERGPIDNNANVQYRNVTGKIEF